MGGGDGGKEARIASEEEGVVYGFHMKGRVHPRELMGWWSTGGGSGGVREAEEDDDKEMGSDNIGGEVQMQAEMGEMCPRLNHLCVIILFPYCSILVILHSRCLLTWRDRGSAPFLNTTYLLVCSLSTFSLVDLSSDTLIS